MKACHMSLSTPRRYLELDEASDGRAVRVVVALELIELELERVPRAVEVLIEPQQSLAQELVRAHLG